MTKLGILEVADENRIAGWAIDSRQPSPLIVLLLDGRPFATVRADLRRPDVLRAHGHENAGFSFAMTPSLLDLIPAGSVVGARFEDGERLPSRAVLKVGRGPVDLFATLARGHSVSPKSGAVYRPIGSNPRWATVTGHTYSHARELFRERLGLELFVAYGSLLGLARDGRFLAHDDDFDAAFFSSATDVDGVARDLLSVANELHALGNKVSVLDQGSLHLTLPHMSPMFDVFVFARLNGRLLGYQVYREIGENPFTPPIEFELAGLKYAAPRLTDEVLAAIYGAWRIPDPHFQWRPDRETAVAMRELQAAVDRNRDRYAHLKRL